MNKTTQTISQIVIIVIMGINVVSCQNSTKKLPLQLTIDLPPEGSPGDRKPAGGRGCLPELKNPNEPLTALVPYSNFGLTISSSPIFWFYFPDEPTDNIKAEFVLQNIQKKNLYQSEINLINTPGIIKIKLPQDTVSLEENQSYFWQFKVICLGKVSDKIEEVEILSGAIKRVPSPSDFSKLSLAEKVVYSAENGLWFDLVTSLIELRSTNPNEELYNNYWHNLWETVDLEYIETKSLVDCCHPVTKEES
jgi:hypothetical protein